MLTSPRKNYLRQNNKIKIPTEITGIAGLSKNG